MSGAFTAIASVLKSAVGPTNITLPLIDNPIPGVGETILFTPGTWTGAVSFHYFVLRDGVVSADIGNQPFYQTVTADGAHTLTVQVVATNLAGGTTSVVSNVGALVGANNAVLKLFADYGTGVVIGDQITTWTDLGAENNNATQPTMSAQPLLENGPNGKLGVLNDGVSTNLFNTSTTLPTGNPAVTLFCVANPSAYAGGSEIFGWGNNGGMGSRMAMFLDLSGNLIFECGGIGAGGGAAPLNTVSILTVVYNGTNLGQAQNYVNGVPAAMSGTGTPNVLSSELCLGAIPSTNLFFYNGYIYETSIFFGAWSKANLNFRGNFLAAYYGLTWTNIT